ncbi:GAF domain-containing protein [Halobaculum sp. MBLA0143]|uniref:GAF domain-containing protein n=1 Tax=Halobaculum sp. MBLA0143 TaxID=3079933 RepID=UPI0035238E52
MDREGSICTFTILEDDVMTVSDVTADPRFRSRSETLIDMGVRSYMGANMVTSSGLRIGSVCVYDDVPREFDADEEVYLADLAELAVT